MGRQLPSWEYVSTSEDWENLAHFKALFDKNLPFFVQASGLSVPVERIPRVLHFIWLGPKPFPEASKARVQGWIAMHPGWKVKFWTDRRRLLPHPEMEEVLVCDFPFSTLEGIYYKAQNWGEKSDILRYEILHSEGGVYVDHDVKCLRSFTALNAAYDFYCGLELPSETPLRTTIHCTNNLIAAKAGHPVLAQCLQNVREGWDLWEARFPKSERAQHWDEVIQGVAHRTFNAFAEAVKNRAGEAQDIVFPAYYFNAPTEDKALFARHLYAGSWFEKESSFEQATRQRLMKLSKKVNQLLMLGAALMGMHLLSLLLRRGRGWLALLVLFSVSGLAAKSLSFEQLMGQGSREYAQLQELDLRELKFYKELYLKNLYLADEGASGIPRVMHWIWLGPKPFPASSIPYLRSWRAAHPDWTMKFWTDRGDAPCPLEGMEKHLISELTESRLWEKYAKAQNWGEKSDLLRYEILLDEGGVYIDHDVECHGKSLSMLHASLDFYACLERPHSVDGLYIRIFPGNALIGAKANHPILLEAMKRVEAGNDTFVSFVQATRSRAGAPGNRDLLLPAACFVPHQILSSRNIARLMALPLPVVTHHFASTWIVQPPKSDWQKAELRSKKRHRRLQGRVKWLYAICALNLALVAILIPYRRR